MEEFMDLNRNNKVSTDNNKEVIRIENNLIEIAEGMLQDIRTDISEKNVRSIPIAELANLGSGISSLIPELRTVTQTSRINTDGLYRLANAQIGDTLKIAKDGNFWGAFKTAEGKSKFAKLQAADSLSITNTTVMSIDPATMMMSVALFSIEQNLQDIRKMGKQILSFLEVEKESEIEADLDTLLDIISQYKYNWDNDHFIASNHKMVIDIKRTARKQMKSYEKKVNEAINSKQFIIAQGIVDSTMRDLQKKFKYYRLSLYTFSMACLIEIMLSGNFKEENITGIKSEIEKYSLDYKNIYTQGSIYLEKMMGDSLETNVLKSIVDSFAEISNPGTDIFVEKMDDMIHIYNHTSEIYFDNKKIYLVSE